MVGWFKRQIIPHGGNNYRPHLLHGEGARKVLLLVLAFECFIFFFPTLSFYDRAKEKIAAVLPVVLSSLTNDMRKEENLPPLVHSEALSRAAQLKADDMAAKGYFAHTSPEGKTPWYWLRQAGYDYQYAGENLAINFRDSEDVTRAWMQSPGHRANLLKGVYTEIGTAVATGLYEGRETVFVAQVYASPRVVALAKRQAPVAKETVFATADASVQQAPQTAVLGAETVVTESVPDVTLTEKAAVSPARTANTILLIIAGVLFVAIVLTVVVKIHVQHPDLITNGMAVIAIIGGVIIGNNFIAASELQTSQLEYSFVVEEQQNTW